MTKQRTIRHTFLSYPKTLGERLYSIFLGPLLFIIVLFIVLKFFSFTPGNIENINISRLILASLHTLSRLICAYVLALVCAVPLALLATANNTTEKIFLPMFDILESVPVLAFFPVLILFFIRINFLNGAAIFIIFLSMLWNIVFTIVGGLKIIPKDIIYASKVFGIRGWKYLFQVLLPAIFPEIVTGSILAFAQGWNLIIIAEVIHTYIPNATQSQDLFGIGSILVNASASGQTDMFLICIGVMIVVIGCINYFVWQKLIHYAERFKFE
ncbi:MAG: ABC transporter permease subunit [Patescibacteria group bacterium]